MIILLYLKKPEKEKRFVTERPRDRRFISRRGARRQREWTCEGGILTQQTVVVTFKLEFGRCPLQDKQNEKMCHYTKTICETDRRIN